jgi:hypothetical protein
MIKDAISVDPDATVLFKTEFGLNGRTATFYVRWDGKTLEIEGRGPVSVSPVGSNFVEITRK